MDDFEIIRELLEEVPVSGRDNDQILVKQAALAGLRIVERLTHALETIADNTGKKS